MPVCWPVTSDLDVGAILPGGDGQIDASSKSAISGLFEDNKEVIYIKEEGRLEIVCGGTKYINSVLCLAWRALCNRWVKIFIQSRRYLRRGKHNYYVININNYLQVSIITSSDSQSQRRGQRSLEICITCLLFFIEKSLNCTQKPMVLSTQLFIYSPINPLTLLGLEEDVSGHIFLITQDTLPVLEIFLNTHDLWFPRELSAKGVFQASSMTTFYIPVLRITRSCWVFSLIVSTGVASSLK